MEFGAHLPLLALQSRSWSIDGLANYARTAESLDFQVLAANDHLIFSRPWLDGPTALAGVLSATREITLATTVALPVVRGPVALAKSLGAIDLLSNGRLVVGVGPGSSAHDYAAIRIPFDERWPRFEESILALRALWQVDHPGYCGRFYDTREIELAPPPAQQPSPPIWIGSWGSPAGLRRVARLADGWLASAYNTTPEQFSSARESLCEKLEDTGKEPEDFPHAIATMFMYLAEDRDAANRILREQLSPTLSRPESELRERLLVGGAADAAEKLNAYRQAGAQAVYVWPVADELEQLKRFREAVAPSVT